MKKLKEWPDVPEQPKKQTATELIEGAGNCIVELLISHNCNLRDVQLKINEHIAKCMNGYHEAMDELQGKREDNQ